MKQNSLWLGKARGSAGDMTASVWKGIKYVKQKAATVNYRGTPAQLAVNRRFKLLGLAGRSILATLQLGFKSTAIKMSEYNRFVKSNYETATQDSGSVASFDVNNVVVASGTLVNPDSGFTKTVTLREVVVDWASEAPAPGKNASDLFCMVALTSAGEAYGFNTSVLRSDLQAAIEIPNATAMNTFSYYGFFVNADLNNASDSEKF